MITIVRYPKRKKGLLIAASLSVVTHAVLYLVVYYAPIFGLGMTGQAEKTAVAKKMKYPNGYIGFRAPEKIQSLEDQKKEQAKLAKREAERRRQEEERRREQEERAQREAEEKAADEKAKAEELAKAQQSETAQPDQPNKADGYGAFGKINTAPIKDQVKRLYDANKEGKLSLPAGKMKIGVTGTVKPDGTLADYKITESSGIKEIDDAALAILDAVSESKAMGPLHQLTSLSLVLSIDQEAQLIVTGFTANEEDARNITNLAQAALLVARLKKPNAPGAMLMLNNLKVRREGQRIQAIISMPREKAQESLSKTMEKGQV